MARAIDPKPPRVVLWLSEPLLDHERRLDHELPEPWLDRDDRLLHPDCFSGCPQDGVSAGIVDGAAGGVVPGIAWPGPPGCTTGRASGLQRGSRDAE